MDSRPTLVSFLLLCFPSEYGNMRHSRNLKSREILNCFLILEAAYSAVEIHEVHFTNYGAAELNGTSSKFVGSSSPQIDAAWNALFRGKNHK